MDEMAQYRSLHEAVYYGDDTSVIQILERLLKQEPDVSRLLNEGLIAALDKVGKEFADGLLFLPEVMLSAHAVQEGMQLLEPLLARAGVEPRGSVVIGTVRNDQHDIGKNIVTMMLRGAGFRVRDLGIDVGPERFVAEAAQGASQVVAMSVLLSTSLVWVERTVEALAAAGFRDRTKILVGGAVMDESRARSCGADGYAPDAARAVDVCKKLVGILPE